MKCVGEICHVSSKRIRLQFADAKGNKSKMARLGERLGALEPVTKVETDPRTGSVVLCHDSREDEVLSAVEGDPELPINLHYRPKPVVLSKQIKQQIKKSVRRANKKVVFISEGTLDIASVVGLTLLGFAIYQMRHGFFLPAGMTMALLAYKTLDDDRKRA